MKPLTRNQQIAIWAIIIPGILVIIGWFVRSQLYSIKINGNNNSVLQNLPTTEITGNNNSVNMIFLYGVGGNTKDTIKTIENDETINPSEKESLLLFLREMDNIPDDTRKKFVENYLKTPEEFQKALQQVTMPAQGVEKASLIGKIFRKYIIGELSYEDAFKLSYMVNYVFWGDLQKFILDKNLKIDETNQSLVAAGVYKVSVSGGGYRARYNPAGIGYIVTEYGHKLFEIANGIDEKKN